MNLQRLLQAVNSSSVIRYSVKLAALSGDGLVCPPTYKAVPPHIAIREGFINGERRKVVVLDSPQSQSNRIEHALLEACRAGRIHYPDIVIEFPGMNEPSISVLQLSNRIYDACLIHSEFEKQSFFKTEIGKAIKEARPDKATALFEHAPITLVLGGWDSQQRGGPRAAKIQRLITSEIIGLDAQETSLSATKLDILDIRGEDLIDANYPTHSPQTKEGQVKKLRPSNLGFGSIPCTGGKRAAVISGAIQTSVLSCSGLRSLSFPCDNGDVDPERNQAGRAVLAALVLYGFFAQMEAGYLLRSRCELVPEDDGQLELIGRTLKNVTKVHLSGDDTLALLNQATEYAAAFDLGFRSEVLTLTPDDLLVKLIEHSRTAALAEVGENKP